MRFLMNNEEYRIIAAKKSSYSLCVPWFFFDNSASLRKNV